MSVTDRARAERVRATIDCWAMAIASKHRPPPSQPAQQKPQQHTNPQPTRSERG